MTKEECMALLRRYADYDGMGIQNLAGCKEAMRTAVDLLSAEPSLPSNLDEAAEIYADESCFDDPEFTATKLAFEAGAEWMAGQGFISEGIVNQTSGEDTFIELNEHIGYLEDCEEVIVNIRKK